MRCLYREKLYYCGDYLDVDIFPVYEKQSGRGKRRKPTSETMKRLNQRNAERKLTRLLNTNFTKKDIRFDLTYDEKHLPMDAPAAQREMQNFIRRVKRYREKNGLPELKYVAVTETGEKGGRLHHHLVMSGGVDITILAELWGRGYTTAKPLQFNESGIAGIAVYLVKSPILWKRWSASRNLKQPKITERDGRLPQYKIKELHNSTNDNRAMVEEWYKPYRLTDCRAYYNEINGGYYVQLTFHASKSKAIPSMAVGPSPRKSTSSF